MDSVRGCPEGFFGGKECGAPSQGMIRSLPELARESATGVTSDVEPKAVDISTGGDIILYCSTVVKQKVRKGLQEKSDVCAEIKRNEVE